MNITLDDLYCYANELSQRHWGVDYDGIIELKNRRWKSINGRFCSPLPSATGIPPIIEMCSKRNAERTYEEVKSTLLHELVHWWLYINGKPHRDRNHEFIAECLRVGAPISRATKAQRALIDYQKALDKGIHVGSRKKGFAY